MTITLRPIGIIHTDLRPLEAASGPRLTPDELRVRMAARPPSAERGRVEVFEEFAPGLTDLEGFDELSLVFWFHRSRRAADLAPFVSPPRGVFATHSPSRPNLIGITVVRLIERRGNILTVEGVDMYEGTPLLDIKPVGRSRHAAGSGES